MSKEELPFDDTSGYYEEIGSSDVLLVCFSGYLAKKGKPTFQFYSSLKHMSCDKVFVRDLHTLAFLGGIDAETNSFDQLERKLQKAISQKEYRRVCFMGSSMGSFAAIILATRLQVDSIIAFSPPTFFTKYKRWKHKDDRWAVDVNRLYKSGVSRKLWDLKKDLRRNSGYTTNIFIFYSERMEIDKIHALRMEKTKNVTLIPIKEGGHNVARMFVRQGKLPTIMEHALAGDYDYLTQA